MAISLNHQARVATTSFILFCAALFLTAYSSRHPEVGQTGFAFLAEIQRPFQIVSNSISSTVSNSWNGYIDLRGAREENKTLHERLDTLESYNSRLLEFKYENDRLRKLLGFVEQNKISAVAATIIGYDPSNLSQTVILDRGRQHNVEIEMPVLQGDSVVGQIVAVSAHSSRALLITDPSSGVDAIVQGTRVRGVVRGTSRSSICDLMYVEADEPLKVGDRVITSGLDQIFPKGLLIGVVSDVNRQSGSELKIEVIPSVDFTKLENVLVVTEKGKS